MQGAVGEEAVGVLSVSLLATLQPEVGPRKKGEAWLKAEGNKPGFGLLLLTLLDSEAASLQLRQAAAVQFKNYVKYHWVVDDKEEAGSVAEVQEGEKGQTRAHIVDLMLRSPPLIQAQLSEALSLISTHDFPSKWTTLLPELRARLEAACASSPALDLPVLTGVLRTANSIFKRFRHAYRADQLLLELKYCLDNFVPPLQGLLPSTANLVIQHSATQADATSAATLRAVLQCQRLICRIFFSLNAQDLPEVFEDQLEVWMGAFHTYLCYDFPALAETNPEKEGVLDHLKAAVCDNINLYMGRFEDEFQQFLPTFVRDVWGLLVGLSSTPLGLSPGRDPLAILALRFLSTVSCSVHHTLFQDPTTLQQICESIVAPNICFRDEDEELFEMNYLEYIRRDMEGSDSDTRRRMACELIKGLCTHHRAQVSHLFSQYISAELARYASAPQANWRAKDAAVFLVVALGVRHKTAEAGATATSELVNLGDFFSAQILPELQGADPLSHPVLKADALKFLTTFRSQIPKSACVPLMPSLVRFLASDSNVLHSYAAIAVERLFSLKDSGSFRFSEEEVGATAQPLLAALFGALKLPDSQENQYVMKCMMRVLSRCTLAPPVAAQSLHLLSETLSAVCKNPTNPSFNHYLFEAVAALVRRAIQADPSQTPLFEATLFPIMQTVLEQDVQEFAPYIFQILAMLIDLRGAPPLPQPYMAVFPALISPILWERPANVPALVTLLQAYLQKAAKEVVAADQLGAVLGVFQMLIASRHRDHHGFFILNTVVERLDYATLAQYIPTVWTLLFLRLQKSRTPKFVRSLIVFMSLFAAKHGANTVADSVNAVQPGLFVQIIGGVWAPNLHTITGKVETKLCAVASAEVLCHCSCMLTEDAAPAWGKLLGAVVSLLSQPEDERAAAAAAEEEEEEDTIEAEGGVGGGYATVYAQLHHAGIKEEDPVKDKTDDARQYLVVQLGQLCAQSPGRHAALIDSTLEANTKSALSQLCTNYGVALA